MLLPVLQVLFALVSLACVVLAEPQNADVNLPATRPRNPDRVRPDRLYNPRLENLNNLPRLRRGTIPIGEWPFFRLPAVVLIFGPGAVLQPVQPPTSPPVVAPPKVTTTVAPPAVKTTPAFEIGFE